METKICTKCGVEKILSEFRKHKGHKFGVSSSCNVCHKIYMLKYYKLNKEKAQKYKKVYYKKYPWKRVFGSILYRCNNEKCDDYKYYGGRGIKCLITEEEVKELWFRDKAYSLKIPSINRKDNDGNYTFDNCEFIEQGINTTEVNNRTKRKPILQFDLRGNFIQEWESGSLVAKTLHILHTNLSSAINKPNKSCGGFKWKYKEI